MQAKGIKMADIYTLSFKNFRSLENATIEVAPLTVVYGPNGSGKSSLIYGLLTLRNFLTNPNQNMPSLFSYPSISLGGLHEVVHRHTSEKGVEISIGISNPDELSSKFTLKLKESGAAVELSFDETSVGNEKIVDWPRILRMTIAIPYQGNQLEEGTFSIFDRPSRSVHQNDSIVPGTLFFNGTSLGASMTPDVSSYSDIAPQLFARANLAMEVARHTGFVPLRRGFSRPFFGLSSATPNLASEDEVASLLGSPTDRFAIHEISGFVEKIAGRRIQPHAQIGTSTFTIDSIPIGNGVPASIVNEGFGINQLVYMLTICLYSRYKIVAIEEPEIHLHPSMVRELAIALAEIAVEKDRRLIISTHSETFVVALLSQIAAGKISPDDVSFVLAENPNGSTVLTQQKATSNGQIEGGLRAFMASEAKDLVDFLGLSSEWGRPA